MKNYSVLLLTVGLVIVPRLAPALVTGTAHDETAYVATMGVCSVCHIPHKAAGDRLWPSTPGAVSSFGLVGNLCFACHYSTGDYAATLTDAPSDEFVYNFWEDNPPNPAGVDAYGHGLMLDDLTALGDTAAGSNLPYTGGTNLIGGFPGIECTSCHNVHDDINRPFLRLPLESLCDECHQDRGEGDGTFAGYGSANPGYHPLGTNVFGDNDDPGNSPIDMQPIFEIQDGGPRAYSLGGKLTGKNPEGIGSVTCSTCHAVHGSQHDVEDIVSPITTPMKPWKNLLVVGQSTGFDNAADGGMKLDRGSYLCEGCHVNSEPTWDAGGGALYIEGDVLVAVAIAAGLQSQIIHTEPNPGGTAYTHPCNDLGSRRDALVVNFPADWPAGLEPGGPIPGGGIVTPVPICESCHTPHPLANIDRANINTPSETHILRAGSWSGDPTALGICDYCHTGPLSQHHPVGVSYNPAGAPDIGDADTILECSDCHNGAGAHNWLAFGTSFPSLDPDWIPNTVPSPDNVVYSDNGRYEESTINRRYVNYSSQTCENCHFLAASGVRRSSPTLNFADDGSLVFGEYQDLGDGSHYLGNTDNLKLNLANGSSDNVTIGSFNVTTTNWPTGGWSRFDASHGIANNHLVCESCHDLELGKNVSGTHLLLGSYIEGETNDFNIFCHRCHGVMNVATGTHPMTGDIVSRTRQPLSTLSSDRTWLDPIAPNALGGTSTYPHVNGMNCDSCHQPHDAATNGGTFILEAPNTNVVGGGLINIETRTGGLGHPLQVDYNNPCDHARFCDQCHVYLK